MLGPPGAGKGTQAERIAAATSMPHIATGDIFRANVRTGTPLGAQAKAHMDRGNLVPDELVIGMVTGRLCEADAADGFLLDGFPRTVAQAEALEAFLEQRGVPLDVVLRFNLSEEQIVSRIVDRRSCPVDGSVYHLRFAPPSHDERCDRCGTELIQRQDDAEDVVRHRIAEYWAKTAPLEAFYADRSILVDIDATGAVDDVSRRTMVVLQRLAAVADRGRIVDLTAQPQEQLPG